MIQKETAKDLFLVTTEELMQMFRVSRQTITNWKDQGMPAYSRGKWDIKKIFIWYVDKSNVERELTQQESNSETDKIRKTRIEADLKQIELDLQLGKLIEMDVAINELSKVMTIVRNTITSLPNKIAPQVVGRPLKEIKLKLQKEINESVRAIDFSKYYEVKKPVTKRKKKV